MKLISMTDFVLEQHNNNPQKFGDYTDMSMCILKYARFLKQPLNLEMFIPVDDEGNILKGKPLSPASDSEWSEWEEKEWQYQKAKEKVLFEEFDVTDFEHTDKGVMMNSKKWKSVWMIESLTVEEMVYTNATLTPSAIKQIGL